MVVNNNDNAMIIKRGIDVNRIKKSSSDLTTEQLIKLKITSEGDYSWARFGYS